MRKRACPACAARYAQLIDPDCPVCRGAGTLVLGAAALSMYPPEVVSMAVSLALEAVARVTDQRLTLSEDRTGPVREAVAQLVAGGALARPEPPAPRPTTVLPRRRDDQGRYTFETDPAALAEEYVDQPVLPFDLAVTTAGRYNYLEEDRPNARGLPLLSANGDPSHLARICDPEEPGAATWSKVRQQRRDLSHAEALRAAVPEAARLRTHRKRRTAA